MIVRVHYLARPICCLLLMVLVLPASLLLGGPVGAVPQGISTTAGPAALVKDINTIASPTPDAWPANFLTIGDTTYFSAKDRANGDGPEMPGGELWKTDGTAAGTALVRDIWPGPKESRPSQLTDVGGTLFFTADDGTGGGQLWKSDGTAAGTVLIKKCIPTGGDVLLDSLISLNGTLFFSAAGGLWKSDGTAAGTVQVKTLPDGIRQPLVRVNNTLFFIVIDVITGSDLWKSDGTAAGTVMVKDNVTGPSSAFPEQLTAVGNTLFFTANDGMGGGNIWKSDGTAAGTTVVHSGGAQLTAVNDVLFFTMTLYGEPNTRKELWKSNGTAAGTVSVKEIDATNLTNVNGTLFFSGNNNSGSGIELWKSNGTAAGTVLVKDINPGANSSSPARLTRVGSQVFFSADNGSAGEELWKSNGTAADTTLVKEIAPGNAGGFLPFDSRPVLAEANGRLLFGAFQDASGLELWKSDGTAAGTALVKDINGGNDSMLPDFNQNRADVNGTLFFVADAGLNNGRTELWKSNGTAAGTVMVKDINPTGSSNPRELTNVGGTLFFAADDGEHGEELWKSDGTAAGTVMVKDINPEVTSFPANSEPRELTNFNGTLFFRAGYGTSAGRELWKSDGTEAGTTLVKDIYPTSDSSPQDLTVVSGTLFFSAYTDAGQELWKSNGTAAGTVMVKDINPGPNDAEVNWLTDVQGTLFFAANGGSANGYELWKSDGTAAGTVMVKDVNPGVEHSSPSYLTAVAGRLFFLANDGVRGNELWRSDGTAAGTVMVKDINPGAAGSFALSLTELGGVLLLSANDGSSGYELWRSDGTAAGTTRVADIAAGESGSSPSSITPIPQTGRALFSAYAGVSGVELWVTDGTAQGTALLQDIAPGAGSSSPKNMIVVGSRVFLMANDNSHGVELWALQAAAALPALKVYLPLVQR